MGRDHHGRCFTVWLAGAGMQPGIEYGRTDDFCYNIAENPVHLRDLHATMLHILGIDHKRFTYPFRGLDVQAHRRRRSPRRAGNFGLICCIPRPFGAAPPLKLRVDAPKSVVV